MAEMDLGDLRADNPLKIDNPALIPAARYHDEDFYRLECERVWPHVWQMACRLEQIPNVGDWIEYSNVGKSVIVVRTKDGVKAHQNHCRHRGVPIAGGAGNAEGQHAHGNCAKSGFICPFHGWRWNMEGECTFVYGRHLFDEEVLQKDELALRPVRVETWGGCAFINHDADAPSLRDSLGPVLDRLEARGMSKLRSQWWFATVLPANWKVAMEAFMEGYHVMKTHPQLQHAQPSLYNARYGHETGGIGATINPNLSVRDNVEEALASMELLGAGMAGLVQPKEIAIARDLADAPLPDDPQLAMMTWYGLVCQAITDRLRAAGEDVPDLPRVMQEHPVEAVEFLFPHYFLLTYFTSMSSYRIRPLGPESCLFELWSLTHYPEGQEPEVPREPVMLPFDSPDFPMIPRQDYANIPIQQKGLHSQGLDVVRLSQDREGLISNYQRLIDGYIAGVSGERLAAANRKLGGNFDGPILDLGLD
ncbi:aromatic ring-hydroxylating oxygenase subunit alpha [Novosphingobium sp. JCM 18896]|uniref:aromatic ring-hydroxylating oxygenase subunit alpha n=1 Tax=Novosphingobium sp. JCM 18896 TaxID=2989731 RepID=UPI0022227F71|nr:aromatic ring-hydroxylating dioxygenase subunit alpha [Novosphingobium sp. JCM 18896]MCW1428992.1 aromatic ring-hydroxylating dioxygenase subunit alpha [Novosphingobium sp. JCM 18896]